MEPNIAIVGVLADGRVVHHWKLRDRAMAIRMARFLAPRRPDQRIKVITTIKFVQTVEIEIPWEEEAEPEPVLKTAAELRKAG